MLRSLVQVFTLVIVIHVSTARGDTLCGRVAVNDSGTYFLVKDLANLGTAGGYPSRKIYRLEDENGKCSKLLRESVGSFTCFDGYHHGERALTFVTTEPATEQ